MTLSFRQAAAEAVIPHLLIWGDSGTGKTSTAVLAAVDRDVDLRAAARGEGPRPEGDSRVLLLTGEPNAIETARAHNPQCGLVNFGRTSTGSERTWFVSFAEAEEVLQAAAAGELSGMFDRIAIDGLTELQRQLAEVLDRNSKTFWNDLVSETQRILRLIRSIPMPVVCTGLSQVRENPETKTEHVGPALDPKSMPGFAMSTMAATGRAARVGEGDALRYAVDLRLPSRYLVKESGPLTGRVKPCAAAWLAVLRGDLDPAEIRFAGPEPAAERAAAAPDASNAAPASGVRSGARRVPR